MVGKCSVAEAIRLTEKFSVKEDGHQKRVRKGEERALAEG